MILVLADNQRLVAEKLDKAGVALNLGWHETVPPEEIAEKLSDLLAGGIKLQEMSIRGQQLVDGQGCWRILSYMKDRELKIRPASAEDCRLVWEWANDFQARAVSFSSDPIPWEEHVQWFESKLNDPECFFFIAMDGEDTPVGQVRYDIKDKTAVISVSIASQFRGMGYGRRTIRQASEKLFQIVDVDIIYAYVKQTNEASVRAFIKAGFNQRAMTTIHGHQALELVLKRNELGDR